MPKNAVPITLTEDEIKYLNSLVQKNTIEARIYKRARVLLLKSQGLSNEAIADKLTGNIVKEIYVPKKIINIVMK